MQVGDVVQNTNRANSALHVVGVVTSIDDKYYTATVMHFSQSRKTFLSLNIENTYLLGDVGMEILVSTAPAPTAPEEPEPEAPLDEESKQEAVENEYQHAPKAPENATATP